MCTILINNFIMFLYNIPSLHVTFLTTNIKKMYPVNSQIALSILGKPRLYMPMFCFLINIYKFESIIKPVCNGGIPIDIYYIKHNCEPLYAVSCFLILNII